MKIRTASEIVYSLYRMVLQENRILFPCNRRLEEFVKNAPDQPEHMVEYCEEFCRTLEDEAVDKAVEAWMNWTKYDYPKDTAVCPEPLLRGLRTVVERAETADRGVVGGMLNWEKCLAWRKNFG